MSRTITEISKDIRMAHMKSVQMPGNVDETKWNEAKKKVHDEYAYSEDDPRFWEIVEKIYQNMVGK